MGFGAAKAGVVNMTQCMALELGDEGSFVNCIAPGSVITEGTRILWGNKDASSSDSEQYDGGSNQGSVYSGNTGRMMEMIPAGRPGQGDDIAMGVLFLAGSNYTNGHCLVIDGGCVYPTVLMAGS